MQSIRDMQLVTADGTPAIAAINAMNSALMTLEEQVMKVRRRNQHHIYTSQHLL